jgi:HK97 family phage prohead protease
VSTGNVVHGVAVPFSTWQRIDTEKGPFMEKFQPDAFKGFLKRQKKPLPLLVSHGQDAVGRIPFAALRLMPTRDALLYEAELFDGPYSPQVRQAVAAGLYSASISFHVRREDFTPRPDRSSWNPDRFPESVVREAGLTEVSLVLRPAYDAASAALRTVKAGAVPVVRRPARQLERTPA